MGVRRIANSLYSFRHVRLCPSVRPTARSNSAPTERLMKFDVCLHFENMTRKFKFQYNLTRIKSIIEEDRWQYGACALHTGYLRLQTHRFAFTGQQFLRDRASMLLYTYSACLWCGLAAHGELQQVDTAKVLTPVMAQQERRVLHNTANPVIFCESPTCCSNK